ncbi:MAG: hypothetical protein KJN96_02415, partial [Eudoraea sp.]|nr:hypothetical protein [Eudoraea sp.]
LKDPFNRSVLTEILKDLEKDVSGSSHYQLLKLYKDLGLHEEAILSLKSRRWEVLAKGILELTEMQVTEAYGLIKKHINHRRSIVRKQAQIATVSLKHEGINYFLDSTRYSLSEWQQLKLLDVIRQLEDFQPPKFRNWLTSRNPDVVLFALRLIKFYKQSDARESIITLIYHKRQHIKIEAVQCIREFGIHEATEPLKKAFKKGNEEVKLLILDTLGLLGDEKDLNFLQNIKRKSKSHIISSKALSVINTIKPESVLPESDIEVPDKTSEESPIPINEINSTVMEKEEEETLSSIRLPEPDFQEDPMAWEDLLDPDYEDELVFSLCCLDEFRDLIQEIGEPLLKAGDPGTLPLDFLPVVTEMPADKPSTETVEEVQSDSRENPDECLISLSDQEEHPEERITREIEALITQDEQDDTPQPAEDDCFDLNFLPLLVDENIQEKVLEKPIDKAEILPLEVIGEELRQRIPEAYADADRIPENWSWQVLPKETYEAVKSIDWADIAVKNMAFELAAEAENRQQGKSKTASAEELSPYGYSIFEELFRTADTESKLILLDELLTIGDEKEWFFLTTLVDDPSIHVRKKAAKVQAELESRLSFTLPETERPNDNVDQSIETAVDQENTGPLFELGFELDPEYGAESHTEEGQDSSIKEDDVAIGKFLSHFKAFSHKILDKFYG